MRKVKIVVFIVSVLLFTFLNKLDAQDLTPTKDKALINLQVVNKDEQPQKENITFFSEKYGNEFIAITNENGLLSILLPVNDIYSIDIGNQIGYDKVEIPNEKEYTLNYKIYYEIKKKQTLLKLYVHNVNDEPLIEDVEIINDKTNEKYTTKTNQLGRAEIIIPSNAHYIVNFKNAPNYEEFTLPDIDKLEYTFDISFEGSKDGKLYPTRDMALIKFYYVNLNNEGVPNEKLMIHSENSNKFYETTTNNNGYAEILIPNGDTYHFSVKYFRDFQFTTIPDAKVLNETEVRLTFLPSKKYEKREEERLKLARMKDALAVFNLEPDINDYINKSKDILESTTLEIRNSIKNDTNYFQKKRYSVNSVLYRLRNKWKNKVIVTDVTCSMHPYIFELLQWHILKLTADESNQYIFFNDGDGMPNDLKKIGKTGGIHYANTDNIDTLLTNLYEARKYGCSGDTPENDIEALIEAKQYMQGKWELILIADNYSPVRDIELLEKLEMPVHIILCGLDASVHEHYLEIAHKTNGSIHTIGEDIENLSKVNEGERITINGYTYYFTRGKFILVK